MKRALSTLAAAVFLSLPVLASAAGLTSAYIFKYNMHKIYDNYNNAEICLTLQKYDIADIYLRNILMNINDAKLHIPEKRKDGSKIDRLKFEERLVELEKKVSGLKSIINSAEVVKAKELPREVLSTCTSCHEDARLGVLLKFPPERTSLFAEYMHKVRDHSDLVNIYMSDGAMDSIEENLKLTGYYLDLLENTPLKTKSGEMFDKETAASIIVGLEAANEEMLRNIMQKQPVNIELFRQKMKELCSACHEPGRLK